MFFYKISKITDVQNYTGVERQVFYFSSYILITKSAFFKKMSRS